ncbi:MAG TPA: glycosyltransferase [Bacteroidota bacterium]|nr:glycosyltransferase [Bacteroidota bacterium]
MMTRHPRKIEDFKKVLFVTFFWPPSGKATVHWPLSMARHLRSFGWHPVVLTADKDTFAHADVSLVDKADASIRVVRARALEPFGLYRSLLGKQKDEPLLASEAISIDNRSLRHRLSIWIRMNLFVPDARIGWYWDAVKVGKQLLQSESIDAVISIGPPHTAHLVGKTLSTRFRIPHIPVFIDPWVDIVYYRNFTRNRLTLTLDRKFEQSVLQNASTVIFVTESMKEDYQKKYVWLKRKSRVLYWGYDEADFVNMKPMRSKGKEILLHTGNIFDYQNPVELWNTIAREVRKGRNLELVFVGTVSPGIKRSIESAGLSTRTVFKGFLPYREVVRELMRASYLLVCATEKRHVPGKLFEYLRTGKPILAFGDDNAEVERILKEAHAGMLYPLLSNAQEFFRNAGKIRRRMPPIKKYARIEIAHELAAILDSLLP